jgi:hypothetical protein
VKGWSVARLYPQSGLRPYGDVDLFLPPGERERARALLEPTDVEVDIEDHDLADLSQDELYARSRVIALDGMEVRVLSEEHTLRSLALHQLRHGLWRPLWLVDVGVVLESLSPGFDWDVCLAGSRFVTEGVECVAALAHRLLGARVEGTPPAARVRRLPRWLVPAVMEQWPRLSAHYYDGVPLSERLRHPGTIFAAIRARWPGPIQATVSRGAPFNDWPRWPYQVADYLSRFAGFLARLPGDLTRPR